MRYSADAGQKEHDKRATGKGPALKISKDHKLAEYLESNIGAGEGKNSLYAAIENIKNSNLIFETDICYKQYTTYLDMNLFIKFSNKDLPVKKEWNKARLSQNPAGNNKPNGCEYCRPANRNRPSGRVWELGNGYSY